MKTAVEWFALELYEKFEMKGNGKVFDELLEQAKEMEKKQIMDAYKSHHDLGHIYGLDAEQYYHKTFKAE